MIARCHWVELGELACSGCGGHVLAEPAVDLPGQDFSHSDGSALCGATAELPQQPDVLDESGGVRRRRLERTCRSLDQSATRVTESSR